MNYSLSMPEWVAFDALEPCLEPRAVLVTVATRKIQLEVLIIIIQMT